MRSVNVLISAVLVAASSGFAEDSADRGNYPLGSDVVVESAVKEVKSIPHDTVHVIAESVSYVADETVQAVHAVASVFEKDLRGTAHNEGLDAVAEAWDSSREILFRSYVVNDSMDATLRERVGDDESASVDVSGFFEGVEFGKRTSALYRPKLKRLFVQQTMENLLDIEYRLADHQGVRDDLFGHQVEIEVKFVEVSQSTLNELGFNWTFGDKYGGDANIFGNLVLPAGQDLLNQGLRTSAAAIGAAVDPSSLVLAKTAGSLRWGLIINAMEQAEDTDVLSAPRIVTLDGETATIEVGEERMVPKSFDATTQNTSVFIQHSDWDMELMGVTLEVTPKIMSDNLIDLELHPKVVDLLGYDTYQVTPNNAGMLLIAGQPHGGQWQNTGRYPIPNVVGGVSDAWAGLTETVQKIIYSDDGSSPHPDTDVNGAGGFYNGSKQTGPQYGYYDQRRRFGKDELIGVPAQSGSLPYFRVREIETLVTVEDGSTIGMGGLIYDKNEHYSDKVPVLGSIPLIGRLFRSEGERSIKRNLMIFVTATQVDVNGRRASELALKK
jgi:hypothetical protein